GGSISWNSSVGVGPDAEGVGPQRRGVVGQGDAELLEVVLAPDAPRDAAGSLHGGYQQRDQDTRDRHDDQEFDQGEAPPERSHAGPHGWDRCYLARSRGGVFADRMNPIPQATIPRASSGEVLRQVRKSPFSRANV